MARYDPREDPDTGSTEDSTLHVTLVHIRVKPEHLDAFIDATRTNHEGSIREPGNFRFDVLQSAQEPDRLVLYESYVDEEAAAAHKQTAHYERWRATVTDWIAEPRVGVPYVGLFPTGDERPSGS
jgi:autoinducer 2-degrading protein